VLSLLAGLPQDGEIIVVDDQSTDGSAAAVTGLADCVTVLRPDERLGAPGARNYGAMHASGEVLLFSDAQVQAATAWAEPLLRALERPDVGAVGPVVAAMGTPECRGCGFRWRDAELGVEWLALQGDSPYPVPMLGGCFVALRRETFAAVEGFDQGLVIWGQEDAELSLRLWTLGYECLLVPEVEVSHLFRARHPYQIDWEILLHNMLRVAAIHFDQRRIAQLVDCMRGNAAFPAAFARLSEGDAWRRRDRLRATRRYDDDWFFRRFEMQV
jgi:GT2 family glycosyltransferase